MKKQKTTLIDFKFLLFFCMHFLYSNLSHSQSLYEIDVKNNNLGSIYIKCKTMSPLVLEITNHNGVTEKYPIYNKLTLNQLAVNVNYPIKIYEYNSGRIRYQNVVVPSVNGPLSIKIKEGNGLIVKWPKPSR